MQPQATLSARLSRFLLVSVAVLLAACSAVTNTGDPSVAATVGDQEITVEQFERRYNSTAANPNNAPRLEQDTTGELRATLQAQVLTSLVQAALLDVGAEELGIEITSDEVNTQRDELIEQVGGEDRFQQITEENQLSDDEVTELIRQQLLRERLSEELVEVSDEELREAYEQQYSGENPFARHILVETRREANAVLERLRSGDDFEAVAREVSTDPSAAQNGGFLGEITPGQTVPEFEEAVMGAEVGELVGPVETQFGFHVIEVVEPPSFEETRGQLEQQLTATESQTAINDYLAEIAAEVDVEVNPRFGTFEPESVSVVAESSEAESSEPAAREAGASEAPTPAATE